MVAFNILLTSRSDLSVLGPQATTKQTRLPLLVDGSCTLRFVAWWDALGMIQRDSHLGKMCLTEQKIQFVLGIKIYMLGGKGCWTTIQRYMGSCTLSRYEVLYWSHKEETVIW